jgi:hypothetical protein
MPTPDLPSLGDNPTLKQVTDYLIKLQRDYTWLLQNLDDLNVKRITADSIYTGTIDANVATIRSDLNAGAYVQIDGNGLVINNGSINTFEADIDGAVTMTSATIRNDLSGSAYVQIDDTGLVINNGSYNTFQADINGAVTMTSATIQSQSGYPKVVMDPATNLFGAYSDASTFIEIDPYHEDNKPAILFNDGDLSVGIIDAADDLTVNGLFGLKLRAGTGPISLSTMSLDGIEFDSWSVINNIATGHHLQQDLDAKATSGASTSTDGLHNHGIPNGTVLLVDGGGTVTFVSSGSHSHTQS